MKSIHQLWLGAGLLTILALGTAFSTMRPVIAASAPANATKGPLPTTKLPIVKDREVATFAAGCFWSMEAIFKELKGVDKVTPGYAGGHVKAPSYEQVENSTTGHAESIQVIFDSKVISYHDLLAVLLTVRNPTTRDRQGNDFGPQYRMILFYNDAAQKKVADQTIAEFTKSKVWPAPIIAEVQPFANFYDAEAYHLDYYKLHPEQPYCAAVIAPEIEEFHAKFKSKLKP